MTHDYRRLSVLLGPLVLLGAGPVIVSAQPSLDEIVVTARRRAESFQDVPVTITAFSESDIRDAGIERPQDFVALTPNVTLVETQNQGTSFLTVRGISQARNSEPSVAVLVDGVLMSNPAQFTQELFDVQQIEVLKGAQGAVYGRNAIGGAIVITTREPGDEFEGRLKLGYDSGPATKVQLSGDGPLGGSDTLKYHAAVSYYDTDGYIDNPFLGEEADPFKDTSARLRLIWEPSEKLRADARLYMSGVNTQALFFNIVTDVNDTSLPVRVNNAGQNDRDLSQLSFKLDYDTDFGTFTSITSFDTVEEILTGDQFDFLPVQESLFFFLGSIGVPGFGTYDWAQSQFLDVDMMSQEIRFTSDADARLRWIAGAYFITTDRYISTGNIMDRGEGAFAVYHTPRGTSPVFGDAFINPAFPNSGQITFLADSQDNSAWAAFGELAYDLSDRLELAFALRYDEDQREQTTLTPTPFLPNVPGFPQGFTGEVRTNTWSESQPRLTLRFEPSDNVTLFGGYSKGFRSGGFNQTGVGPLAASLGIAGVGDLFDAEIAETLEFGLKSQFADNRVNLNFSVFDTSAEGSYFFVFLARNSTQNLGSLAEVDYKGFEVDLTARLGENFDAFFGYGDTDSEIVRSATPSDIGNQAPLVSENTVNVGAQYQHPIGSRGLELFLRADYHRIGKTYWDPANSTVRDPVNLLDLRAGVNGNGWSLIAWQKNFNDAQYNAEFSPGGFVFKAKPRRWGIDFIKEF
ncbi:MAG TPA: TonB-dependent receptor [Gammaproteobacteria bacterium]|nr:TonB-dependent receptor [Gammaproteobacteria bacterium]